MDLKAIRERADAATQGPWHTIGDIYVYAPIGAVADTPINEDTEYITRARGVGRDATIEEQRLNLEFIAAARTDVPALCDEVERLRTLARAVIEDSKASAAWRDTMTSQSCDDLEAALEG